MVRHPLLPLSAQTGMRRRRPHQQAGPPVLTGMAPSRSLAPQGCGGFVDVNAGHRLGSRALSDTGAGRR